MPRLVVLFHRLGPYHVARCAATGSCSPLTVIELSAVDATYAWSRVNGAPNFTRVTLFEDEDVDCKRRSEVARQVHSALDAADPEVVAIPGWSHPAALAALQWSSRRCRPAVLMSDSTEDDERRRWWREAVKRRIVALGSAALAAGTPQCAYLYGLGLAEDAVFTGYDAVDNAYFADRAAQVRAAAEAQRVSLGLPERFFLASSRFVAKKNLVRLLEGYALYRRRAGLDHWRLVLLGDGELRQALLSRIAELDLAAEVRLPGFKQYDELPAYYGLASAFVQASTTEPWGLVVNEAMASGLPVIVSNRCGCAPDLVEDGVNGFTFDPHDVEALAELMHRVAAMPDERRRAMGRAGQRTIADWGPERFADGLMSAVDVALSRPPPQPSPADQALLWALIHR